MRRSLFALAIALHFSIAFAIADEPIDTIKPDPEIQTLIDGYVRTNAWTPESYQKLLALREVQLRKSGVAPRPDRNSPPAPLAREGEKLLICQAAYYSKCAPSVYGKAN